MAKKKRPRDTNQLAKFIVDLSTGEEKEPDLDKGKNPHALALSKLGASKGGKARAKSLTAKKRSEIAKKAVAARWKKAKKAAKK